VICYGQTILDLKFRRGSKLDLIVLHVLDATLDKHSMRKYAPQRID